MVHVAFVLRWLATPGDAQLRLMGSPSYEPGLELTEMLESAVDGIGQLPDSRLRSSTKARLRKLLRNLSDQIGRTPNATSPESLLHDPFWEICRKRSGALLSELGIHYEEPTAIAVIE